MSEISVGQAQGLTCRTCVIWTSPETASIEKSTFGLLIITSNGFPALRPLVCSDAYNSMSMLLRSAKAKGLEASNMFEA